MEPPRLEVIAPDAPPQQVALNDPAVTIGRHRSNRLVIPDDRASRFHCVVEQTPEGFRLRDLHSKNGTKLNNQRITSAYLKVGDQFRIGKTIFAFSIPEGYQLPPPPHPPKPDLGYSKKINSGSRSGVHGHGHGHAQSRDHRPRDPHDARAREGRDSREKPVPIAKDGSGVIPMPTDDPTPVPLSVADHDVEVLASPTASREPHASPAAGLSFAQPPSEQKAPAPTPAPAPSTRPAKPAQAGYYAASQQAASDHALAMPPTHSQAASKPPPTASPTASATSALPAFPISPPILATMVENLKAFARFEHDSNPDAILGESHLVPVNTANPQNQSLAQLHPNDPAALPLKLFKHIALAALRARGSHLLIEPRTSGISVRTRIDGALVEVTQLAKPVAEPLAALLRLLTNLPAPPASGPVAQEGRFRLALPDRPIDCSLTLTPSVQGITISIRLADPRAIPQHLPDLSLPLPVTRLLADAMRHTAGLVLVSGPAGSGLSTTLYASLRQLDLRQMHVITIESQIDSPIDGVTQVPYDDSQPASLGPMIRVALKQSPSALLVGDLPDRDAVQAVLHAVDQGYLVIAGIHAREPVAAMSRLLDLGATPTQLASNVRLVLSQRLVRLLCPYCKAQTIATPEQSQRLAAVNAPAASVFVAKGCPRCFNSGYMLRRPLASALVVNDASRAGIEHASNTQDLRNALAPSATPATRRLAEEMVAQGLTSFDEADRATA